MAQVFGTPGITVVASRDSRIFDDINIRGTVTGRVPSHLSQGELELMARGKLVPRRTYFSQALQEQPIQ